MSAKVTAKAVSQVSEQLPSFIGEDFPLYEKFVKNYFEFLETIVVPYGIVTGYENDYTFTVGETVTGQTSGATAVVKGTGANSGLNKLFLEPTNTLDFAAEETIIGSTSSAYGSVTSVTRNPVNALKLFTSLIDPSQTSEGVLEFFKKEFYPNIRNSSTTDLRKFIQHLKDFYRSKGSEKSFRTLFRILYGQENVDFYFPKTDLLKVSDGKWSQDVILQLPYDSNYLNFNGLTITAFSSNTTAFVSNVTDRKLGTIPIIELVVTNVSGTFTVGETIRATTASGTILSATITGQMTDIIINDGGAGYRDGESLVITDSTLNGFGAAATIARTSRDQVTVMTVDNAGSGFQVNDTFTFDNTATNTNVTAEAKVKTLTDTYTVDVITTQIYQTLQSVSFEIDGASVALPFTVSVQSGNLVADNAVFSDATKVGEIISITNQELHIYDRGSENNRISLEDSSGYIELEDSTDNILNETIALSTFVNGDLLFLFDENENSISGATSCTINDGTFTNPTSHVDINAANYGSALNTANRTSTFTSAMTSETQTFGSIGTIDITSHGSGYESKPTATISNDYYSNLYEPSGTGFRGRNATITIGDLGGSIVDIKGGTISESGFGYITEPTVTATVNALSSGSSSADLSAILTVLRTKDGVFTDDSGKPSSIKKVQDNDYYQDFSYVIQTADSINVWKQDTLKLLHPAGMKLFGEVAITTLLNATMFDRGLSNINSVLSNGITEYRELIINLLTEVLNNSNILVGVSSEIEVDISEVVQTNLSARTSSIVYEYIRAFLSSLGIPAEFFVLGSVKDVSTVTSEPFILEMEDSSGSIMLEEDYRFEFEDGSGYIEQEDVSDNLINEENTVALNKFLAEESKTTIQTSEPHYFHENDEIYLDNFAGTNVDKINGRLFKVTEVDVENSSILIDSTDGSSDAGDKILLETNDSLLKEEISVFTLSDPTSFTDYNSIENPYDEVDTSSVNITTNGKVYRPGKTASSGVPISLLTHEFIGEYADYQVHNYFHHNPYDDSSITPDMKFDFRSRKITIGSNILNEEGDEILLEDGDNTTSGTYSGTTSTLGSILGDDGNLIDTGVKIIMTEAQQQTVFGGFITDEDDIADDKIIFEDSSGILLEETGSVNGIITFDEPFDYKSHPYDSNNGFLYAGHLADQRVSV